MNETLQKSKYTELSYEQLSKIINEKYAEKPDLREIAKELGISVSVAFEATGWKDYWELVVDKE